MNEISSIAWPHPCNAPSIWVWMCMFCARKLPTIFTPCV